jgi:4a-hydroxytetrahydrobiopterin dehydratase
MSPDVHTHAQLLAAQCIHMEQALNAADIAHYLGLLPGWQMLEGKLCKTFSFRNYYESLAFLNAAAFVIHAQDHHPETVLTYNRCTLKFDTHSVNGGKGGISINDFICAAKIDTLIHYVEKA